MPVHLQLSQDQRYLVYEISEPLNMNELLQAYEKEKQYRDSLPHVVHSIVDMSKMRRIPVNWLTAKAGPGLTHPRSGEMLFVGLSIGIRMIVETILKLMNYKRMRLFSTRQEAEDYMTELITRTLTQQT
jgi:hypothetical protein